jgi:multidrug efflux pump subunit AcrA (membrane-fusion protein)
MASEVDLRQLALDRSAAAPPRRSRRAVFSRYVLPGAVLLGFLTMLGWAARDQYLPRKAVTVVPVVVTRADVQEAGAPLFQAAGWIEPRPTAMVVSALAEGVVEELLVVEGQEVEVGQPVARLIEADARLALEQAQADLALRSAELEGAEAELRAARLRLENPVHLKATLAEAKALLAKTETDLARIPFLVQGAEARVEFARQNLAGKQGAGAALAERAVQQAQSEYDAALAELQELEGRKPKLEQEAGALRERQDAAARQLELLIDETLQAASAEAGVKSAQARERQSQLALQGAQLRLDRMVVKAPAAGRVLALVAQPGSRVMGLDPAAEHKASTVVTLYNPQMLQVRADVRLEDVLLVAPGQPVQVETASAKAPIRGEVLYATSQANIQKNTLEVKVALIDPPPAIRPEMLVTATFLAPESAAEDSGGQRPMRLLAPRRLVESDGDGHAVWIADADQIARRKSIRLGSAAAGDLVEVAEGLTPTDRLISGGREVLSDGDRITITGEDGSLGMNQVDPESYLWRLLKFAT